MLSFSGSLTLACLSLGATFILSSVSNAIRNLRLHHTVSTFKNVGKSFFFSKILKFFFPQRESEVLSFSTVCGKTICGFLFCWFYFLAIDHLYILETTSTLTILKWFLSGLTFLILFSDFLPRVLAQKYPLKAIQFFSFPVSIILMIQLPILSPFIWSSRWIFHKKKPLNAPHTLLQLKEKIIDLLEESTTTHSLHPTEQKLIESMISFKDRVVREVMIPRVEIFALSSTLSIKNLIKEFEDKEFSRIPIFQETFDQIIGVIMFKDIFPILLECEKKQDFSLLEGNITPLIKPVLYTPETKKISLLLQEFRHKQMHIAIVVDEYGETEGLITIEDILEEIVGEIADEYDEEKELFTIQPQGGWIVDAKMNVLDIEEKLGIKISQEGDYDTLGGYIFHKVGEIPLKGLIIHDDTFDLEIISSNERCVEKVLIKPLSSSS